MLPKALLAVRRGRGRLYPRYADPGDEKHRGLAEVLIQLYQEHLGRKRGELDEGREALETHQTFKLVRGLAELLDRRCEFEAPGPMTRNSPIDISPQALRGHLFRRGYVTSPEERKRALEEAARELGLEVEGIESLFWADLEEEQLLQRFDPPSPPELLREYNLALTQTLLFDATELEVVVRGNFQEIFRRIKRLGLMYELEAVNESHVKIKVSGPASILGQTTRYGTSFAKLLPAIIRAEEWSIRAKIKIPALAQARYEFTLDSAKRGLLATEQEAEEETSLLDFDSKVERDFAGRIRHIMPEWEIKREPTALKAGRYAFIPDFGFFLRRPGQREPVARLYLEIVGFWTEDYLKRKISKLREVSAEVPLMIAVDRSLNCSALDFRVTSMREVFFYEGTLPLEPVIARLQQLAEEQTREELKRLSDQDQEISLPDKKVVPLTELAEKHGVGVEVIRQIIEERLATDTTYKLIGDKLVAREALEELREKIEALPYLEDGKSRDYFQVKELLKGLGLPEQALKEIGYRVEWRQLLPPDARVI